MEIEYFIPPDEEAWQAFHDEWIQASFRFRREGLHILKVAFESRTSRNFLAHNGQASFDWSISIGLRPDLLTRDVHPAHKLAHYARACTDVMFQFPFGKQARYPPSPPVRTGRRACDNRNCWAVQRAVTMTYASTRPVPVLAGRIDGNEERHPILVL